MPTASHTRLGTSRNATPFDCALLRSGCFRDLLRLRIGWAVMALIVAAGLGVSACAGRPIPPADPPASRQPATSPVPTSRPPSRPPSATPAAPTPTPAPSATPAPALRRLTEPGCCTQAEWSLDGRQVIFLDKPSADAPAGFYAVDVSQPGAAPTLLTDWVVNYSTDFQLAVYPKGQLTIVERLDSGQRWEVDTRGLLPALSPDNTRLVWEDTAESGPYDARRSELWLAELADSPAPPSRLVLALYGGGVAAWFPDSQRLLALGRPALDSQECSLFVLSLADGTTLELARAERISGIALSPGGTWVAYFTSFAADASQNGIWLVCTDGTLRHKLELFGAYQWRDDDRLLLIPLQPGTASDVVWQVDAASGELAQLTDPAVTPFKIAGGDWCAAPDGTGLVFLNAADKALWLLTFDG